MSADFRPSTLDSCLRDKSRGSRMGGTEVRATRFRRSNFKFRISIFVFVSRHRPLVFAAFVGAVAEGRAVLLVLLEQ